MLKKDDDPIEAFRVKYVMSRPGEKAVEYTIPKRRENAENPNISVDDIFDQLLTRLHWISSKYIYVKIID